MKACINPMQKALADDKALVEDSPSKRQLSVTPETSALSRMLIENEDICPVSFLFLPPNFPCQQKRAPRLR